MRILHNEFLNVLEQKIDIKTKYMCICEKLYGFYERYPTYFKGMLETIASDTKSREQSEILENIYRIGEMLNDNIKVLIQEGMSKNNFMKVGFKMMLKSILKGGDDFE